MALPRIAPVTTPAMTLAPAVQPEQRASAGAAAKRKTVIDVAAASASKVLLMVVSCISRLSRPSSTPESVKRAPQRLRECGEVAMRWCHKREKKITEARETLEPLRPLRCGSGGRCNLLIYSPRPPGVTPAAGTCHTHRIRDGANDRHDSYQKADRRRSLRKSYSLT
jgi:hypothetical protein